jgi:hypothetical protein
MLILASMYQNFTCGACKTVKKRFLSPVRKAFAHNQLPPSDHREHSSGHRSNEQSHRCCSSCKSWLSLLLCFCSRCFTVVCRILSFADCERAVFVATRCLSLWSTAHSNVRLMSLFGRCRSPQHHMIRLSSFLHHFAFSFTLPVSFLFLSTASSTLSLPVYPRTGLRE